MLLEILMGFLSSKWKWSPLKRNHGESQVCLRFHLSLCKRFEKRTCKNYFLQRIYFSLFIIFIIMLPFTGADLSDYFNYGFNEDTWKAYCEKQKRLRMGLEVSAVSSVTSKITVRNLNVCCVFHSILVLS